MDDYRPFLKNTHVLPIGRLMEEDCPVHDEQIVSIAGIVQSVKMKTTRNNSMMAYVTVEDDTAAIELLAFSNVLNQYGGYLRDNTAVVITGKLSLRDDKEPQIIVNRARPITDYSEMTDMPESGQQLRSQPAQQGTLWLQLPCVEDHRLKKVKAIVNMFPGNSVVKIFLADTRKIMGGRATLDERMLQELRNLLGTENIVVK